MKILIAGCGDLGQRTGLKLLNSGHQVLALSRHRPEASPLVWFEADLQQPATLLALAEHDIDLICYCAAPKQRTEAAYQALYYQGLAHLLQILPQADCIFVSSSSVYGDTDGQEVDETSPLPQIQGPAHWLQQAELLAWQRNGSVLRLTGIYGPGRYHLLEQIRAGASYATEPPLYSNRIHIDDAAGLLAQLCQLKHRRPCYLGVDQYPAPMQQVADSLRQLLEQQGIACAPRQSLGRNRQNKRCSSRYAAELGYAFHYPDFLSGYKSMISAYRDWLKPS